MGLPTPIIAITFALIALVVLTLAGLAWRRTRTPGSFSFALLMLMVSVWLISAAFETSSRTLAGIIAWSKISYLGIAWVGTLWLFFVIDYIYPERNYVQRLTGFFSVIPAVTIILAMTNELHHLIWVEIIPISTEMGLSASFKHGLWFWVVVFYSYLLLTVGVGIMLANMRRVGRPHRDYIIALLVGMSFPWLANVLYLVGAVKLNGIDMTPYGFTLTGLIYSWILWQNKLFDQLPFAYWTIMENIGDGFLVINSQQRILEANSVACQFLGLRANHIKGQDAGEALKDWPVLLDLLKQPDQSQAEFMVNSDPKTYIEVVLRNWSHREDAPTGLILIFYNITRRRMVEEQLRQSERLYRLLVNSSPVGIMLADENGRINFASPKALELYEIPSDQDVLGQSFLRYIHPEDRPMAVMRMLNVLEDQNENLPPQEYRLIRFDGSLFWGEGTAVPVTDYQGVSQGILAIFRDITQRKQLEIRLQRNLEQQMFINRLLQLLYRPPDLMAAVEQVLEQAGIFLGANRVYLCRDSLDGTETSIVMEWCSAGIHPRARDSLLVRYSTLPSWQAWMAEKNLVHAANSLSAPDDIADFMQIWNINSIIALPVYESDERVYGFLGFDYCDQRKSLNDEETEVFWSVCRIISGAVTQKQVEDAEQRQRALAEALHDTASALNSTLNFEEVLDRILNNLNNVVRHDSASIALVEDDGWVRFVRWRGFDPASVEWLQQNACIPINERETYRLMAETGKPVIISDTWTDKRWDSFGVFSWIRSFAGMPVTIQNKVVGFINLDSKEPDNFPSDLAYSLHVFADQAAVAINNARLFNATRLRAEEMSLIYHIGLNLTAGLEMDQLMLSLLEQCRTALPIDVFYVGLYDREHETIELPLFYEDGKITSVEPQNIRSHPTMSSLVIDQRKSIYLADTLQPDIGKQHQLTRLGGKVARSFVSAPLIFRDEVVGVISMQSFHPNAYSPEQIRLLETIANQAAIAMQNARLYEQMKQMAITDPVTQLFTRRHFTALGRAEVERSFRYHRLVSTLMIDIDHFKLVNDTYGHNTGDQVLLAVATICRQALRLNDVVGRWGGEEFAVILPEAGLREAMITAERLRCHVEETAIDVTQGQVHLTVSIGISVLEPDCGTLEALIDRADQALYKAKQDGRNLVRW